MKLSSAFTRIATEEVETPIDLNKTVETSNYLYESLNRVSDVFLDIRDPGNQQHYPPELLNLANQYLLLIDNLKEKAVQIKYKYHYDAPLRT